MSNVPSMKDLRALDLNQVIYIDFESTDLVDRGNKTFPWILEFSAQHALG